MQHLASLNGTVVEHLTNDSKFKGLNPATFDTGRKLRKNNQLMSKGNYTMAEQMVSNHKLKGSNPSIVVTERKLSK